MRPFTSTISLDEARQRLAANVRPISRTERVPLTEASGRVASADVVSAIDVPPFARSAMDGYAVRSIDVAAASKTNPIDLEIIDRIYTGQMPRTAIGAGTCAEIATGAPVPDGADAVVMVEETTITVEGPAQAVRILKAPTAGQNIGRRGADITIDAVVVSAGNVLTPGRIGSIAAIGRTDVDVYARPRVAILSTGNEVVEPGQRLAPGQIYDVNRFTLAALVAAHGGVPDAHKVAHDSIDALIAALDDCRGADLIVFSGGSSVGERDLVLDIVSARGRMIFHGISIKPGKPTAFALVDDTPFFGMPGNPTSCLSNAYILLIPYLRTTARLPPFTPHIMQAPLGRRIESTVKRHQIYTVRIEDGVAYPAFKGSGDITSLSQADGYIEIPEHHDVVAQGAVVTVTLF